MTTLPFDELQEHRVEDETTLDKILEVDNKVARELWDAIQKHATKNWSKTNVSPPFSYMNVEILTREELNFNQEDIQSRNSQESKGLGPSYLG